MAMSFVSTVSAAKIAAASIAVAMGSRIEVAFRRGSTRAVILPYGMRSDGQKPNTAGATVPCRPMAKKAPTGSKRRDAPRRRRHEFRTDRVGDRLGEDAIDLGLVGRVEGPAAHRVHRLQLAGMASSPEARRDSLVEHPAQREMDHPLAEALLCEPVEPLHRREVLREPRLPELGISATQVVATELRARPHAPGQEAAAESAVSQHGNPVRSAIRQDIAFDR